MEYISTNQALWNAKVPHHLASDFYDLAGFLAGKSSLNSIELDLLGNIEGKKIAHLQCHFGQDSLSLARMGAQVTGFDFSEVAIQKAIELNTQLGLNAQFVCCDLYDIPKLTSEKFDLVFTSYGTIGWLPDLKKWAHVIQQLLKPNGSLIMADFHPVVWMFDAAFTTVAYDYFQSDPIIETEQGTYADPSAPIQAASISWNHGLAELFQALRENNLSLENFQEYDYSPYNCFERLEECESRKFRLAHFKGKMPMVYSIVATNV
jgi:2-polyprenyl-3-methyl-5-hydroxy-6-metoxy-1,4-benzoquinol methylase